MSEIERIMIENMVEIKVTLPYKRLDLLNQIRENGVIDEEESTEQGVKVRAHVPQRMAARFHNDEE